MTCSDELIQLYIDGALHPAEAAILDEHLKGCAACRHRAGLYKGLFWDLAHAERLSPAPDAESAPALAELLQAEWQRGAATAGGGLTTLGYATLWLTANPAATGLFRRLKGGGGR